MNYKFKVGDKVQICDNFEPNRFPKALCKAGDTARIVYVDTKDYRLPYWVEFINIKDGNDEPYRRWLNESELAPTVKPLIMCE